MSEKLTPKYWPNSEVETLKVAAGTIDPTPTQLGLNKKPQMPFSLLLSLPPYMPTVFHFSQPGN